MKGKIYSADMGSENISSRTRLSWHLGSGVFDLFESKGVFSLVVMS